MWPRLGLPRCAFVPALLASCFSSSMFHLKTPLIGTRPPPKDSIHFAPQSPGQCILPGSDAARRFRPAIDVPSSQFGEQRVHLTRGKKTDGTICLAPKRPGDLSETHVAGCPQW